MVYGLPVTGCCVGPQCISYYHLCPLLVNSFRAFQSDYYLESRWPLKYPGLLLDLKWQDKIEC